MTDRADREPQRDDLRARLAALDPARSFIVQAPAGSGKTELLIQRYLVLLSRVECPEEIAAITFTRKAAAEMKMRVLAAFAAAREYERAQSRGEAEPELAAHERLTLEHARAALARDAAQGWRIEENAARLRIQTIDALCASLTRQMPVVAAFGAQPQSVEDAGALYREAARATLALLEQEGEAAGDVAKLLAHLDDDVAVVEELLAGMLRKRDHWIRYLRDLRADAARTALEAALGLVRREAMARAAAMVPAGDAGELLALARYAADNLAAGGAQSAICECADRFVLPGSGDADLYAWLGLADLLLTGAGAWRRTVDVRLGFPAGADKAGKALAKEWKARYAALIARLREDASLGEALDHLRRLPPARYSDAQWEALGAIARLLPLAVAELKLVFAARGEADFVEIAQGALAALGEADAPSDLLLALDYRIHHILVDEFQDTSFTQFELIARLTAGWQPGDGRTLFLVGDPMQSIYRFREAEVGLFLKARSEGIGQVALAPLTLSANFRSQADIVDWVNRSFAQVMPPREDVAAGAVPYSPSEPVHPAEIDAVCVHALFNGDAQGEAAQVALLAAAARSADPRESVAILVRSRSHLREIVPQLKERGLRVRAIEIETLGHRQVVQDLLALTRALSHPADRLAWLAVLRAPWCGLTLADLHALTAAEIPKDLFGTLQAQAGMDGHSGIDTDTRTIWELLHDDTRLAQLCADGRARVLGGGGQDRDGNGAKRGEGNGAKRGEGNGAKRGEGNGAKRLGLREVLDHAMANRLRGSLRHRVETAWLALGGPACVEADTDLADAQAYLDYLERSEQAGEIADENAFEQGLAKLYAAPDLGADPATAVQIMTIHKAKGLEFDTVILPGLGRMLRPRDPSLFLWMERPSQAGAAGSLLLAPIRQAGAAADAIYDFLAHLDAGKAGHEDGRLLYVAATRARKHLHLLGDTRLESSDEGLPASAAPSPASLLGKLWPAVEAQFAEAARQSPAALLPESESVRPAGKGSGVALNQDLRRLPPDWTFPDFPAGVAWPAAEESARARGEIEFSWVGETARHVGSVVHRWLQRIAGDEMHGWSRDRVEKMREVFRDDLAARGVEEKELAAAAERVARALAQSLDGPRGKWLLGPQAQARNEYRMRTAVAGERRNLVIDRTFVDAEGRRWIVDYKTSVHLGAGLDAFLDRERERYAAQLERYARALAPDAGAMLALYFPLAGGWREWPAG